MPAVNGKEGVVEELDRDILNRIAQGMTRRLRAMEGWNALVARVEAEKSGVRIVLRDGGSMFIPIERTAGGKFRWGKTIISQQSH